MRMIKGLLTLRPWVWSNDHSLGAGGEAPDTDTSSASSSSSQSHHQSFPGPKCLSVSSLHLIRPDANCDLAPSGGEEKSEWEHRNTILDLTWKIRIECGPPGVSYNVGMMQKLAEISYRDQFWTRSGVSGVAPHERALIVMSSGIIFKQRGVRPTSNNSRLHSTVQHQYPSYSYVNVGI